MSGFQPLADWKTKKGVPAAIVTTEQISGQYSGSEAERVRAFITDAHANWGTEYVLLGGDSNVIPPYPDAEGYTQDMQYGDLDYSQNGDYTFEVHVGRGSVRTVDETVDEVSDFVQKTLQYEISPVHTDYLKTAGLFGYDMGGPEYFSGEDWNELWVKSEFPAGWQFLEVKDSDSIAQQTHREQEILDLETGCHLVSHIDHGMWEKIGAGAGSHREYLTRGDVQSYLRDTDRPCVFYMPCCWSGDFAAGAGDPCFGEKMLRVRRGGAVAYLGHAWNVPMGAWDPYDPWHPEGRFDMGPVGAQFETWFFRAVFSPDGQSSCYYRLGRCFSWHKSEAYWHWHDNQAPALWSQADDCYKYMVLLGDPELPIWTDEPGTLSVTHPETLAVGGGDEFIVHVESDSADVPDATVCLRKEALYTSGSVYLVATTDSSGDAVFEDVCPGSPGAMDVTVTKHNYLPYQGIGEVQGYALTLDVSGPGTVTANPDSAWYPPDASVELTATPNTGARFDHWTGGLTGSANPGSVTMDSNKSVTAVFWRRGDMNCDGLVNNGDIDHFVQAMFNSAAYIADHDGDPYPVCNILNGDFTGDGYVNTQDYDGFVAALFG